MLTRRYKTLGVWDIYTDRVCHLGTMRDALVEHARNSIAQMIYDSPSCHYVHIDGRPQHVSVTHTEDLNEKRICSVPGEHLTHGGLVHFAKSYWLITELDADDEIYDKGRMVRCNHILRWIGKDGQLREKWCVVEDGTKYLIGEYSERTMAIGDARIALTVTKDEDTEELCRGARFLIDDPDSDSVLAYQITKPNKLYNVFNGRGVFKFILNEVQLTPDDNKALRIADYSNWKPSEEYDGDHKDSELTVAEIVAAAQEEASKPQDDSKGAWI